MEATEVETMATEAEAMSAAEVAVEAAARVAARAAAGAARTTPSSIPRSRNSHSTQCQLGRRRWFAFL